MQHPNAFFHPLLLLHPSSYSPQLSPSTQSANLGKQRLALLTTSPRVGSSSTTSASRSLCPSSSPPPLTLLPLSPSCCREVTSPLPLHPCGIAPSPSATSSAWVGAVALADRSEWESARSLLLTVDVKQPDDFYELLIPLFPSSTPRGPLSFG